MYDPRSPQQPSPGHTENAPGQQRQGMAETLQQALRSLGGDRVEQTGGALSPDALAELANRAGLTNPGQVAGLARMMGVDMSADALGAASVPQHIVFALGDTECAMPADAVQGVERITEITSVPNIATWVLGIVHLRGSMLSVVDLKGFLGLPTQPITQQSRVFVVARRDMVIGMVVDGVIEMRPLGSAQGDLPPGGPVPEWAAPYAVRTVNVEGRSVLLLDPERLLYADKMHHYRTDLA